MSLIQDHREAVASGVMVSPTAQPLILVHLVSKKMHQAMN